MKGTTKTKHTAQQVRTHTQARTHPLAKASRQPQRASSRRGASCCAVPGSVITGPPLSRGHVAHEQHAYDVRVVCVAWTVSPGHRLCSSAAPSTRRRRIAFVRVALVGNSATSNPALQRHRARAQET
jgi:hypothetical protein